MIPSYNSVNWDMSQSFNYLSVSPFRAIKTIHPVLSTLDDSIYANLLTEHRVYIPNKIFQGKKIPIILGFFSSWIRIFFFPDT